MSVTHSRITALDGLRALAVGLVVLDHMTGWFVGGGVGVGIFFVLSGFLITSLLAKELDRDGSIHLLRFYARRALRLYPALLGMLLITALFSSPSADQLLAAGTYWSNVFDWTGHSLGPYGHTWSLAMEEQFYLAWPLLLPLVLGLTRRRGVTILIALAVGAHVCGQLDFAFGLPSHGPLVAYNPIWQAGAIMIGCALALAMQHTTWTPRRPEFLVGIGVFLCLTFAVVESLSLRYGFLMGLVPELAAAAVIVGLLHARRGLARVFSWGPVVWAGRRSYAIYLWHYPLIVFASAHHWRGRGAVLMVGVSVLAAELSWRLIEGPIAKLKARQSSVRVRVEAAPL